MKQLEAGSQYGTHSLPRAGFVVSLMLVVVALSLFWMAGESHYRSCVAKANAKFPAVPVSAFNGRQTGPLKVSFVKERTKAVQSCHRL